MRKIRLASKLIILVTILCTFTLSFLVNTVGAISRYAPDPNEFDINGASAKYVVGKSPNTGDMSYMTIPIYNRSLTEPSSVDLSVYAMQRGEYGGSNKAQYLSVDGGTQFFTGGTKTVELSGFSFDSNTNMWKKSVVFRLRNGSSGSDVQSFYKNRLEFRLSLPSGWYIGNSTGSGYFNTIANDSSAGQKVGHNYEIQMATPCNVNTNTQNSIYLLDLDSGHIDNEYRDITVSVKDVTDNVNVSLTNDGDDGDAQENRISMTFKPNHKYILKINNVSPINNLRYKLPYDNMSYVVQCPPPKVYSLSPSISVSPSVVEVGSNYTTNPSVANGGPTDSNDTNWNLTKIIIPRGIAVNNTSGGNSGSSPCDYFTGAGITCTTPRSGVAVFNMNNTYSRKTGDVFESFTSSADDLNSGDKICYALSVNPRSSSSNQWRHSSLECITVGKKPKVQIWGGDLITRGKAQTSTSDKSGNRFGSWVEYSIYAGAEVSGTASGSAFNSVSGGSTNVCSYNTLTFTNSGSSDSCNSSLLGNYISAASMPDIASVFSGNETPKSGSLRPEDLASGIYSADNLTLNTSVLQPGKTIVIKATGTITIAGNQTYNPNNSGAGYTSINQLPQLIIIAKNININSDVDEVEAWLVALRDEVVGNGGNINTCSSVGYTSNLNDGDCANDLKINGPVIADKLYLRRTAGSGAGNASGNPAEILNLRADTYLWALARASGSGRIRTVYVTDLPPRL